MRFAKAASQAILATPYNLTSLFGPHLSTDANIYLPAYPDLSSQIQQRWTDYNRPTYSIGAIKPATESDVENIVRIATEQNIPFFTTGGGHGISDYHTFDGLSIDLGKFNTVQISEDRSRLTIGGSVKIHQLIKPLYDAGKELPLGSCACVGVVGATLGGGIGGLHGHRGLMLDSLESVRIVTASQGLVEASATKNTDLFWALRGAGSNFGIVTSATFKLQDASNKGNYMNADFVYPAKANASFWKIMETFDETLPSRMAINAVAFYNRITDEPVIAVNVVYYGPKEDGKAHVQPFLDLSPTMHNISMVPADGIMDAAFFNFFGNDNGACTPNQHINIYTVALKQTHAATFESFYTKLVEFWVANPGFQGRLLMQRYSNERPLSVPDSETAYPHRAVKTFMNIEGFYSDTGLDDKVNGFTTSARDEFARTSGFKHLAAYSNYARGDEGAAAWYGARNIPRLIELKQKWDPNSFFSVHNPVPKQWPSGQQFEVDL